MSLFKKRALHLRCLPKFAIFCDGYCGFEPSVSLLSPSPVQCQCPCQHATIIMSLTTVGDRINGPARPGRLDSGRGPGVYSDGWPRARGHAGLGRML